MIASNRSAPLGGALGLRHPSLGCRIAGLGLGLGLLTSPALVHAQASVFETFDADLGAWGFSFGAQANGFDLGWSDTSLAGGSPGEFGGVFVRLNQLTGDLSMPRVLDTGSFAAPLAFDQLIRASGSMFLNDDSDDAGLDVHLGFFDANNPLNERLIIRIQPNGGNQWRFRVSANTSSGARIDAPTSFDSVPLEWSFEWTPSDSGGGGTLTGTVSDGVTTLSLPSPIVGFNTATLDSFGVWANSASSSDPSRTQQMFFDDVLYTVPEPEGGLLGGLAVLATALLRRRVRAASRLAHA